MPFGQINRNLIFETLYLKQSSIIVFPVLSPDFADPANAKIIPLFLSIPVALIIDKRVPFMNLILIPGRIMIGIKQFVGISRFRINFLRQNNQHIYTPILLKKPIPLFSRVPTTIPRSSRRLPVSQQVSGSKAQL